MSSGGRSSAFRLILHGLGDVVLETHVHLCVLWTETVGIEQVNSKPLDTVGNIQKKRSKLD